MPPRRPMTAGDERCGVLGDPVAHSLSPVLHRAGYAALHLPWEYDAHRVPAGGLAAFLAEHGSGYRGLSVTMPLKREALVVAAEVTPRAVLAGSANTLLLEAGRVVLADNTDLPGAVAAVRERYDGPVTRGTVLGGGATAAATGLALCELGAQTVTILVRSPGRAAEAVAAVSAHPSGPDVRVGSLGGDAVTGEIVVSTIPADAQDAELVRRCAGAAVVLEARYEPWPTPLASSAGGRVLVGGLDLLVHQAVRQFELFTGRSVPVSLMREAGQAALRTRRARG